jgi:hypothetical protein
MERKQPNPYKRKVESSSLNLATMGKHQKRVKRQKIVREGTIKPRENTDKLTALSDKKVRKVRIFSEDKEHESSNIVCNEKKRTLTLQTQNK